MKIVIQLVLILAVSSTAFAQSYSTGGRGYRSGIGGYKTQSSRYGADRYYQSARNTNRLQRTIAGAPERKISFERSFSGMSSYDITRSKTHGGLSRGSLNRAVGAGASRGERTIWQGIKDDIYRLFQRWGAYEVD